MISAFRGRRLGGYSSIRHGSLFPCVEVLDGKAGCWSRKIWLYAIVRFLVQLTLQLPGCKMHCPPVE